MLKNNNAVARLYSLLSRLRNSPPQGSVAVALRAHLVLGNDDNFLLLERFGRIFALGKRASSAAKMHGLDSNIFTRWIPKIAASFFSLNLQTPISSLIQMFDQPTMDSLEACAELLSRERPENIIDPEELRSSPMRLLNSAPMRRLPICLVTSRSSSSKTLTSSERGWKITRGLELLQSRMLRRTRLAR